MPAAYLRAWANTGYHERCDGGNGRSVAACLDPVRPAPNGLAHRRFEAAPSTLRYP